MAVNNQEGRGGVPQEGDVGKVPDQVKLTPKGENALKTVTEEGVGEQTSPQDLESLKRAVGALKRIKRFRLP